MSIDLEKLYAGSVVKTYDGHMYKKDGAGNWRHLEMIRSTVMNLTDLYRGELIYEAEVPFNHPTGTVISFSEGNSVVMRKADGDWYFAGSGQPFSNDYIKRVASEFVDVEVLRS